MNKPSKVQDSLAIKTSKLKVKTVATSFPKHYVNQEDCVASDSDYQDAPTEHAMIARAQSAPPPKLTVQSIYGQNYRTNLVKSNSMWHDGRIGFIKPRPRLHEAGLAAAKELYVSPMYWEGDNASFVSSKNSLTTRTQHMEISPHAENLLADYHRHLARVEQYDSDCYIQEDDRAKLPRDQSKEIDREQAQAMEDDRPPRDNQDTVLESSRLGHYSTRRVTRMES